MTTTRSTTRRLAALAALALIAAACGGDDAERSGSTTPVDDASDAPVELVLITHDSFALTPDLLDAFTDRTGIDVELLPSGDAGAALNRAILTKDDPEGDVLFGVDSNLLGRALDEELFLPYRSDALAHVDDALEVDDHVTPIDVGDVCLNYDRAWFQDAGLAPPAGLDDLIEPAYRGLTVVEDPASSSPGLAFLLATVARYGDEGWQGWWGALRANDVEVVSGWEDAYYGSFSGGSGEGERPIVVSYASSPAAEVVFATEPLDEAPTAVVTDSCYRQVEYAGILAGTDHEAEAGQLVDFLLSKDVQADIPLQMFVYPVRDDVELPEAFVEHAARIDAPLTLDPAVVAAQRDALVATWGEVVLR